MGTIDTTQVKDWPAQPPGAVGITEYVAVAAEEDELDSWPVKFDESVLEAPPVKPEPVGVSQVYRVF